MPALYNQNLKRRIRKAWSSGTHPISFGGYSIISRYFPEATDDVIQDALGGIDTYTLFREEKRPKRYNPIYVRNRRELMQSDLIELSSLAKDNHDIKFLLVVIDTFSRFAWVQPLKNKSSSTVLEAFKQIISRMKDGFGKQLMTDQGKEYVNKDFQKYLQQLGTKFVIPNNKCPHVERFNRTFQNILYKYMEEKQTNNYTDKLQDLVTLYNNKYHRIINTSPAEAEKPKNYKKVLNQLEIYYKKAAPKRKKRPKFKIGDHVRISGHKTLFQKGYYQTFKPAIYEISNVLTHLPIPMYKLKDIHKDTQEAGTWYANELTYVSKDYDDTLFKIESIIKTKGKGRNKQALIKWKYWPEQYNSWEPFENIKDLIK